MRPVLSIAILTVFMSTAAAERRREDFTSPGNSNTSAMSCASARSLVDARGAALLTLGPRGFDRFVADNSYCYRTQFATPVFAPTRDNAQCWIGFACVERDEDWLNN